MFELSENSSCLHAARSHLSTVRKDWGATNSDGFLLVAGSAHSELCWLLDLLSESGASHESCLRLCWSHGKSVSVREGVIRTESAGKCWCLVVLRVFTVNRSIVVWKCVMDIECSRGCSPWYLQRFQQFGNGGTWNVVIEHLVQDNELLELVEEEVSHPRSV